MLYIVDMQNLMVFFLQQDETVKILKIIDFYGGSHMMLVHLAERMFFNNRNKFKT
jgi:hypothetical protein